MAFFGVTKEKIGTVKNHPNADRLDIATLEGMNFQFVVGRDQYKVGDDVVYFPIDSLIPPNVLARLGLVNKLSGKEKNRVKTIRLRGEISQGIVSDHDTLAGMSGPDLSNEKITSLLGVKKYEPPAVPTQNGNLVALPLGLGKYDIEGADRYSDAAEQLIDVAVHVTEKVEGMNFSVAYSALKDKVYVNQRSYSIEETPAKSWGGAMARATGKGGHMFWDYARNSGLLAAVEDLGKTTKSDIIVYGEFVGPGVQGNIYGLKEHKVLLFDAKTNGEWQEPASFIDMVENVFQKMNGATVEMVPTIAYNKTLREILDGKTIQEFSDGKSMLADTSREGIVIKPMQNMRSSELGGRFILKQRGPEYLAKSKL